MAEGTDKMVRLSECSSYRGFELSSVFYEKVIVKVQGECQNSSSYWKFELSRVRVIGISLYFGDGLEAILSAIDDNILDENEKFTSEINAVVEDVGVHLPSSGFSCDLCDKVCKTQRGLTTHRNSKYKTAKVMQIKIALMNS